ncbi:MAG: hypothetical protein NT164_04870 [Verrucomicrobiae bacterium]|nr:hypothetical protein [Verrucomicrobiae bacterium]
MPEIQDPSMEHASLSSSGAVGASEVVIPTTSAEQEHLQASGPAAAGASFQGHSVAAAQPKPVYRLAPNGEWEAQHPETKEWHPREDLNARFKDCLLPQPPGSAFQTSAWSHPEDLQSFDVVPQHYNRAEDIDKRKAACQQELREEQIKNPSPESAHRIFALERLIAVLEKASAYQNDMVRHLNDSESPDPKIALLKSPYRLKTLLKINESPNQLERIADQIEIDSQNLLSYQATLNIIQAHIVALPTPAFLAADPNRRVRRTLNSMKSHGEDVITHLKELITAKEAYATALPPPYEPRDEATQAGINQRALDCRREAILVR